MILHTANFHRIEEREPILIAEIHSAKEIMSGSSPDNVINSTASTTITAAIISTTTFSTTVPTQSNLMASVTTEQTHRGALDIDPLRLHAADGIFLQTKTAQGLAGICVWVALFITCQQVREFQFFRKIATFYIRKH